MSQKVTCPFCKRFIPLDALGATDVEGEPVMQWHLVDKNFAHLGQCDGSNRSISEAMRKLPPGPARANAGRHWVSR
jgi:hypothetical protein